MVLAEAVAIPQRKIFALSHSEADQLLAAKGKSELPISFTCLPPWGNARLLVFWKVIRKLDWDWLLRVSVKVGWCKIEMGTKQNKNQEIQQNHWFFDRVCPN